MRFAPNLVQFSCREAKLAGRLIPPKMSTNLEGFKPVFGQAEGVSETAGPHALLPFLFHIHALDDNRLHFQITDFHSNTWQALKTTDQLEELRDEVGIGGSFHDFVSYLGAAFSSNNVKLILGASSTKLVAQKSKGMPRISIYLEKRAEPLASDAMGNISMELFKDFKQKSDALVAEQSRTLQLTGALSAEKEKIEKLQKQLEAFSFASKKKGRKAASSHFLHPSMLDTTLVAGQLDTKTDLLSHTQMPPEQPQSHILSKPATLRTKVRAAPASHRAKHRGVHLADAED